jgi:uncharacterized membrane protein
MLDILQFTAVALAIFIFMDLIWQGLVSKKIYIAEFDNLLRHKPNYFAAVMVYVLLAFGLVFFVTSPAIADANIVFAILGGLAFGFVAYGVYTLTNLALFERWSATIVLVDLTWGSFVLSASSLLTYLIFI